MVIGRPLPHEDVRPDGRCFLMVRRQPRSQTRLDVILNWDEELKRLVPTN